MCIKSLCVKFTSFKSLLFLVAEANATIGAAISAASWQSVFFTSALSIVIPFVIKSSCWAVATILAMVVFSLPTAV